MFESFGVLSPGLYVLGAIAIVLVPGPNSIFVFKTSIQRGLKDAFRASSAVWLGDAVLMFLSYLGVAAAMQAHPGLFQAVRIAGAAYLAYLGLSSLIAAFRREKAENSSSEEKALPSSARPFRTALILSLTNPKAILFYVAFFTQFIDPSYEKAWIPYLVLAGILELLSAAWLSVLCFTGRAVMRFAGRNPQLSKLGNAAVGVLFLGFAGKLIFS